MTKALRKLTLHDVRLIRSVYADYVRDKKRLDSGSSITALARKFEVHKTTIERVVNYSTYKERDAD